MTTVAYKSGILAFDSKITNGGTHKGHISKGRKTSKFICAGCGSVEDLVAVLDWIEAGMIFADKKLFGLEREVDASILVITKKGKVICLDGRLYPYEVESSFHSIGSGAELAMGAMAFGATASQSVKIASRFDAYTGGTIRELKW